MALTTDTAVTPGRAAEATPDKAPRRQKRSRAAGKRLRFGHVSISVTLATAIGTLVAVAVALVLAISFIAGARSTLSLLRGDAETVLDINEASLRQHLDPAAAQLRHMARQVENGGLDLTDPELRFALFSGALAATPQIVTLAFWQPDQDGHAVGHKGGRVEQLDIPLPHHPAVLEAQAAIVGTDRPYWGGASYIDDEILSALNVAQAVYGPDGRYLGMLTASVSVGSLSRFLRDLQSFNTSQRSFILYGISGQVIAHPTMGRVDYNLSEQRPLPTVDELRDPLLTDVFLYMERADGFAVENGEVTVSELPFGEYLTLFRAVDGYATVPLVIGSVFPMDVVTAEMEALFRAGAAGVVILIMGVVAGILVGRRIARPIIELAHQASQIGEYDFASVPKLRPSVFKELNDQSTAFNQMIDSLRRVDPYVPRGLVDRLFATHGETSVESQERDLTVMFTDIVGYTTMSEGLSASETAAFLNEHFGILARCIEAEGGTIDKYIGDALMAFWGAPDPQTDHAARACRAAVGIAEAIHADNAHRQAAGLPPVAMRIGLHSGPMVVGNIGAPGRINYTIVGDPVNTGQRLEQLGKVLGGGAPVTILASAATVAELGGEISRQSLGAQPIPGRSATIEVFRLGPLR